MRFTVTWNRSPETLFAQFDALPGVVLANVAAKVQALTAQLEDLVKTNLTAGTPLVEKTGALLHSIGMDFEADALGATGTVFSRGVPYAHIQEYGGTTPEHGIDPVNAKALRLAVVNLQTNCLGLTDARTTMRKRSKAVDGIGGSRMRADMAALLDPATIVTRASNS